MKFGGFGFKNAFRGIWFAVKSERNFRVHIVALLTVLYFSHVFGVGRLEGAVLALCVGAVLGAELFNSALEAAVDLVSPEKQKKAGLSKDCAAGAVLVLALVSVLVAVFVFWDARGWQRVFDYVTTEYIKLIIFAVLSTIFIFLKTTDKEKS